MRLDDRICLHNAELAEQFVRQQGAEISEWQRSSSGSIRALHGLVDTAACHLITLNVTHINLLPV